MEVVWQANGSTSAFHAAEALLDGRPVLDAKLAAALEEPSRLLAADIDEAGLPRRQVLAQLTALSTDVENNRELADLALVKTIGRNRTSPETVDRLTGRITDLENAFRRAVPDAIDLLTTRGEPLRQQWEARGPGLFTALGRLTEENVIAPRGRVVLVMPVLGGAGVAHLRNNSVRFEAVLTNPHAELPEALRLGWLLAQVNQSLPMYSETIRPQRLPRLARLALLPPVLAASAEVEWARLDEPTLRLALAAWHLVPAASEKNDGNRDEKHVVDEKAPDELTATLLDWWGTYTAGSPRWTVALAALDQMVQ